MKDTQAPAVATTTMDEKMCDGEMGKMGSVVEMEEETKLKGSYTVEKGGTRDLKAVKNRGI